MNVRVRCGPSATRLLSDVRTWILVAAGTFLLVLPVPHTVSLRLFTLFTAGLLIFFAPRADIPPIPLKPMLALWIGVILLSLPAAVNPMYSMAEIKNEVGYTLLAFFIFFSQTRDNTTLNIWMGCLFLTATALCICGLMAWFIGHPSYLGFYLYPGVGAFTTFTIMVLPFFIVALLRVRGSLAYAGWSVVPLLLITAYMAGNRMFWIALIVSLATLFLLLVLGQRPLRKRIVKFGIIPLVILGPLAVVTAFIQRAGATSLLDALTYVSSVDPRIALWQHAIHYIGENPWVGLGFGLRSLGYAYPELLHDKLYYWHVHNIFLDYGVQMGIPGILVLVLLLGAIGREFLLLYRSKRVEVAMLGAAGIAMLTGMVVKNLTDVFFYRESSLLFWVLVGMTLGYARYKLRDDDAFAVAQVRARAA